MFLTKIQTLIIILSVALGTMLTRFTPFILFPENKKQPKIVTYLGQVLPAAMMGLLVVYALKDTKVLSYPYGIPELISIIVVVLLQKWKKNTLISIGVGTVIYMILVQKVFI